MTTGSRSGLTAITHLPSAKLDAGERTYVGHEPIDAALAMRQHEGYRDALRRCGADVITLDANRDHPDGVFVEDTAIVLDELAVITWPSATSRQAENEEDPLVFLRRTCSTVEE